MRAENLDAFAVDVGPSRRTRRVRADDIDDALRWPFEVDVQVAARDRPRQARLAALRHRLELTVFSQVDGFRKRVGAGRGQSVVQLAIGFIRRDRDAFLENDVAGVEAGIH